MAPAIGSARTGEGRRPLWAPMFGGFLGRVGSSYRAVSSDRSALVNALRDAAQLAGSELHVVLPDPTLLAEAAGAQLSWSSPDALPCVAYAPWAARIPASAPAGIAQNGRLSCALGAYRDLHTAEPNGRLAIALAGPGLLALQLRGPRFASELAEAGPDAEDLLDLAGQLALQVVRAAGGIRVDLVVVLEASAMVARAPGVVAEGWRPIANLATFYDAPILAVWADGGQADAVAADAGTADALDMLPATWVLRALPPLGAGAPPPSGAALGIPEGMLGADWLVGALDASACGPAILSTTGPLSIEASAAGLRSVKSWLEAPGATVASQASQASQASTQTRASQAGEAGR